MAIFLKGTQNGQFWPKCKGGTLCKILKIGHFLSLLRKRSYGFGTLSFLPHERLLQPVATSVLANWPITGRLPIFVKRDFDRKFISNFSDFAALFPTLGANSEVQVVGPGNFNDFAALVLTLGANSGREITDVRGSI